MYGQKKRQQSMRERHGHEDQKQSRNKIKESRTADCEAHLQELIALGRFEISCFAETVQRLPQPVAI